jgi:hypothetical protein
MRLLQGSHASRLAFASVCLGSSAAWLVRPLVASGRRLRWSLSAAVRLLVVCFRGRCWSLGCSPGCKVRGVMDRGGLDGLSFERGGRSADYVPASLVSVGWSLSASMLACFACFALLGLRGGRADSLLCFELARLRARRAGLRLLASPASVASLGSAIHSSSPRCVGRSSLRCSLLTCSGCWALPSPSPVVGVAALLYPSACTCLPCLLASTARASPPRLLRSPRLAGSAGVSLALLSTVRRG